MSIPILVTSNWGAKLSKPGSKFFCKSKHRYFVYRIFFFSSTKKCLTLIWKVRHINRSFDSFYSQAVLAFRALTQNLQLGLLGPNWESKHSKHACPNVVLPNVACPSVAVGTGEHSEPPSPSKVLRGPSPLERS